MKLQAVPASEEAVRLDCDAAVKPLNDLYESDGYRIAGDCEKGLSLLIEKTL